MAKAVSIPGQKVPQGRYSAFVPAPLPPTLNWTPRLIGLLSDADRLIGKLAGEGGRLPNPHVLMRPFIRREAVLSSKIEGTQATLGELLAADLQRVAREIGPSLITSVMYAERGKHGATAMLSRFGSWNEALSAAGLNLNNRIHIPESLSEN
jgi:hypothetical protein